VEEKGDKPVAIESSVILPKRTTMGIFSYELRVPYKQIRDRIKNSGNIRMVLASQNHNDLNL